MNSIKTIDTFLQGNMSEINPHREEDLMHSFHVLISLRGLKFKEDVKVIKLCFMFFIFTLYA